MVASYPPAIPFGLEPERRAHADAHAHAVHQLVGEEERGQQRKAARIASVDAGDRAAADLLAEVAAAVLEVRSGVDPEARRSELRSGEQRHAGGVVVDRGGIGSDRAFAGVCAAHAPSGLLEEQETGALRGL